MNEIVLGLTGCVGFMGIGAFIFWLFSAKPQTISPVPDLPSIPPPPRYMPKKIHETRYGQNLLDLAEKIYLNGMHGAPYKPGTRAEIAVKKAHELLVEIEDHCNKIDEAKKKTSLEEAEKAFREMSKL